MQASSARFDAFNNGQMICLSPQAFCVAAGVHFDRSVQDEANGSRNGVRDRHWPVSWQSPSSYAIYAWLIEWTWFPVKNLPMAHCVRLLATVSSFQEVKTLGS